MKVVSFPSHGESCAAWHLTGEGDAFAGEHGRPCVVMAHGLGATKDSGLLPFAEAFAGAGLDVLLFDYRCFGESTGEPRQLAWPARHREDYAAAVEFARGLDGVDPDRIVLWGTSWSGGHVVYVAADDPRIAAVISQTPDLDGVRTLREIGQYAGLGQQLRVTLVGIKDALRMRRGEEPLMLATVGRPGELAAMTSEESEPGMRAIAGPTLAQRGRGSRRLRRVDRTGRSPGWTSFAAPILVLIADRDSVAPPAAARAAAWRAKGRVEVREYPCAALRHLRRRVARALDRRPAPLPAPPPGRRRGPRAGRSKLRDVISDVSEQDFQAKVIERSKQVPVVVDFWAEWCGPCRTLGPALEQAVSARNGEIELAKLDTDRNPNVAMKYEIASIPAVKAFKDGEVVAEFIGAVPPARIEAFLNEIVPSEADRLAESGDEESLRKALELDPGHAQAAVGLSRLLLSRGEDEEALEVLKPFPHDFVADGLAARAQLSASANGAGADELQRAFAAWDDGDPGEALEQLQGVLASEQDAQRKDQLRRVMVAIFTELGADHPLAREHRRRLAAALN